MVARFKTFIKEVSEAPYPDVLFHFTTLHKAQSILKNKRFELSTGIGTASDRVKDTNKDWFLSTAHHASADFAGTWAHGTGIQFELDKDYLNSRYKVAPRDYWEGDWWKGRKGGGTHTSEQEERIWSNKPYIDFSKNPGKVIRAIHVLNDVSHQDKDFQPSFHKAARQLMIDAKKAGIPVYYYDNPRDFLTTNQLRRKKLHDVLNDLKGTPDPSHMMKRTDFLKPYRELIYQRDRKKLSKTAERRLQSILYYDYEAPALMDADIHNASKSSNEYEREGLAKTVSAMQEFGTTDTKVFVKKMQKKWFDIMDNPCKYPWNKAKDRTRCGKRASSLKEANYGPGDWGWGMKPEADMKFKEMAQQQRGKPEIAMLQVQRAMSGGILSPVVEHIGDLTNRISPAHPYEWAIDESLKKIDRGLGYLTNGYGFDREFEENIGANARARKTDEHELRHEIYNALNKYAEEHAKLPVYNEVQWLAREAAVSLGKREWSSATNYLRNLKDILENEPERAKEHNHDLSQYDRLIDRARKFAIKAHGDQKRKYTGNPYWYHLRDVANICRTFGLPREAIAAAWLHDTVEDTPVSIHEVRAAFGDRIAALVDQLTDISKPEDGNRATRKKIDREHYRGADPLAQSVKLADLINNTADITTNDPKFAKVYVKEKELLLPYLKRGNAKMFAYANQQVAKYKKDLDNPCKHPWNRAKDKSRCGKRASNV